MKKKIGFSEPKYGIIGMACGATGDNFCYWYI